MLPAFSISMSIGIMHALNEVKMNKRRQFVVTDKWICLGISKRDVT